MLGLLGLAPAKEILSLNAYWQDRMVLQQNSSTLLSGESLPNATIKIQLSWERETTTIIADKNGHWIVDIPSPKAGVGYSLEVSTGKLSKKIKDVLCGDVWLCSGQSNMEWTPKWGIKGGEDIIAQANDSKLRLLTVERHATTKPVGEIKGFWNECNPKHLQDFSAVAFFFGHYLREKLDVPIGLISCAWGGTPAQDWMTREALEANPYFKDFAQKIPGKLPEGENEGHYPSTLYNGMINPLRIMTPKGVIWYQGEANVYENIYHELFPALIKNWRSWWGEKLPFYYVQIAPFRYEDGLSGMAVREAQRITMDSLEHLGMVVTTDISDVDDIHPRNKQEVGRRLALWALAKTYGMEVISYSGPLFKGFELIDSDSPFTTIELFFDHLDAIEGRSEALVGFEWVDIYGVAHPLEAILKSNVVEAKLPRSSEPKYIQFGWNDTASCHFFNKAGLPASPFRVPIIGF